MLKCFPVLSTKASTINITAKRAKTYAVGEKIGIIFSINKGIFSISHFFIGGHKRPKESPLVTNKTYFQKTKILPLDYHIFRKLQ